MTWKGIAIGGVLGGLVGRSPWGVLLGAMIGHQINQRMARSRRRGRPSGRAAAQDGGRDPLAQAYAMLGARPSDSSAEIVRKFRRLAKKHHPDVLRAKSRPEAEIKAATERMSRINAAWAMVKTARGI